MSDARQYVAAHNTDALSLATVAKAAGASVFQVCKVFHKSTGPTLPVIPVTSSDAYHAAAVGYANGAAACLARPISAAELRTVIKGVREQKLQPPFA